MISVSLPFPYLRDQEKAAENFGEGKDIEQGQQNFASSLFPKTSDHRKIQEERAEEKGKESGAAEVQKSFRCGLRGQENDRKEKGDDPVQNLHNEHEKAHTSVDDFGIVPSAGE